jgi:hypothetical protein
MNAQGGGAVGQNVIKWVNGCGGHIALTVEHGKTGTTRLR